MAQEQQNAHDRKYGGATAALYVTAVDKQVKKTAPRRRSRAAGLVCYSDPMACPAANF